MKIAARKLIAGVFLVVGIAGALLCFKLLLDGSPGSALVAALVSIICIAAGNPGLFKSVQLGLTSGLRVELQELRDNVKELRILTEAFAKYFYWNQVAAGRWGGAGDAEGEIDKVITEHLQNLGLTLGDIEKIKNVQLPFLRFDCANE